jgi:hypothetical protein
MREQSVTQFHSRLRDTYSSSSAGLMDTADWPVPSKPRRTTDTRRGIVTGFWVEKEKDGMFLGNGRWEERGSLQATKGARTTTKRTVRAKDIMVFCGNGWGEV